MMSGRWGQMAMDVSRAEAIKMIRGSSKEKLLYSLQHWNTDPEVKRLIEEEMGARLMGKRR